MDRIFETVKTSSLVQAVLLLAFGLLLVFMPALTIVTVLYFAAIMLAVSGIMSIISYFKVDIADGRPAPVLVSGVALLVCALIIAIFPQAIAGFFSVVLGAILVFCGIVNAVKSWELRSFGDSTWSFSFAVSVLIALGGIVIIVNPFESTSLFVFVLGLVMVVTGIEDLLIEWRARKAKRLEA